MPPIESSVMSTPAGPLCLLVDDGVLIGAGFVAAPSELQARLAAPDRSRPLHSVADLGAVTAALAAYLHGDLIALDRLPVRQPGTPHQHRLWEELRRVAPGTTVTYGDLAARAGSPRAARAAGSACARNLVAPVVPCHRVLHSDGTLGGYGYGLSAKRWLLDHERRHAGAGPLAAG
ncbi:MAG: methylated-DNA--[protein]-cysteine S-methyltransferase [Acidimicrobiales bacterium]